MSCDFKELVKNYTDLLILQYRTKPKASKHIENEAISWIEISETYCDFLSSYDLEKADGIMLDKIGEIVGLSREIPYSIVNDEDFLKFIDMREFNDTNYKTYFDMVSLY